MIEKHAGGACLAKSVSNRAALIQIKEALKDMTQIEESRNLHE
jgi:hypothetical protein